MPLAKTVVGPHTLYLGDCLQRMARLPDHSVDMILADLPYGTTACSWDIVIPLIPLWGHYKRLIKPRGAVVLTASQPFTSILVQSNLPWFKYCWVWEKTLLTDFLNSKNKPLKAHEDICVFSEGTVANRSNFLMPYYPQPRKGRAYNAGKASSDKRTGAWARGNRKPFEIGKVGQNDGNTLMPHSILKIPSERGHHPTQKPAPLMEYLIRTYTQVGGVVLDNTMGSGTTGVACVRTGRRFLGIEKEPKYFYIAKQRIEEELALTNTRLLPAG